MNGLVAPKFAMGQRVFYATHRTQQTMRPCPDCLGSCRWSATTPAGETFEIECSTCSYYMGRHDLMFTTYVPHVRALTVGKIGMEADSRKGGGIVYRYMCNETGIGTGSVYNETLLFDSEEHAMLHARFLAHQAQIDHDQRVQAQRDEHKKRAKRRAKARL